MSDEVEQESDKVGFQVIAKEFLNDIKRSFPEIEFDTDLLYLQGGESLNDDDECVVRVKKFCGEKMLPHFLDILYKNESVFERHASFYLE